MQVLIIVPAYNEEKSIKTVVADIKSSCGKYEYVVVNDGSFDETLEICRAEGFNVIDLPVNLGLSGAFQTGMKYAWENNYDCAIQFDADGQHISEYIEQFVEKIEEGYDIVIGSRFMNGGKGWSMRMIGSRLITAAIKITTGKTIKDPTSGMRMYSKKMLKEFAYNINYGPEPDTVSYLLKNGANACEIDVHMKEREQGESYLNLFGSANYMVKMLVSILLVQNVRKRG